MINVREALSADIPKIVRFQLEMAMETENIELNEAIVTQGVTTCLHNSSLGNYYVAEIDGNVVGSLLITFEWSDWRNGTTWWIQSVYVDVDHRGKGVFKALYETVKSQAVGNDDVKGIRLYADVSNLRAHEVYQKLGMDGDHYKVFEWMKS